MFHGQLQNLAERIYRILTPDWIALQVPNMIICGQHDANHIIGFFTAMKSRQSSCRNSLFSCRKDTDGHCGLLGVGAWTRGRKSRP